MKNRFLPKKADILLIAVLLAASLLPLLLKENPDTVQYEISVDGNTVSSGIISDTTEEKIITLDNGIRISVSADGICFIHSVCNGKDCIKAGLLSRPGDRAACLPAKTVISIKNTRGSATDAITY